MTTNLLDMLGQAVTPDLVGGLGKLLGESDTGIGSGIGSLLPGLLASMANKASTAEGASGLFSMVNDARIDTDLTERLGTLVRGVQSTNLLNLGSQLLSGLFSPDREANLSSALAGSAGIRAASASGLAAAVTPMVFSLLKRLVGERSLDPKGLATLLLGQGQFLRGKLDPGLLSAMGLGTPSGFLDGLGAAASRLTGAVAGAGQAAGHAVGAAGAAAAGGAATAARAAGGGFGRILPWLIGAAVVLYVLAIGQVKGFAFTLGLTTVLDVVVVFLVTWPLVYLASKSPTMAKPAFNGLGAVQQIARERRAAAHSAGRG